VKDKAVGDGVRERLVGLLASLPPDPIVLDALRAAYGAAQTPKLREEIASSLSRTMSPSMTPFLLQIASEKGVAPDVRESALASAAWVASKSDLPAVVKELGAKSLAEKDLAWRTLVPTSASCDPAKIKDEKKKELCSEDPEHPGKNVMWKDMTPTKGEVLAILGKVLACDEDAKCYFTELKKSAPIADADAVALKFTPPGVEAAIRAQKALWMVAAYGTEDDMIALVRLVPSINGPAARAWMQMALEKNLKAGVRVADEIDTMVKELKAKGAETANREAAQLGPIAVKLRVRAAEKK
jgi:hypothetical protein